MTTRGIIAVVSVLGLVGASLALWWHLELEKTAALERERQALQEQRAIDVRREEAALNVRDAAADDFFAVRSKPAADAGSKCDCQPGDPLCSCY